MWCSNKFHGLHYSRRCTNAQKNISEFSEAALNSVRTKDLGEVGGMLGDLVVELQGLNFDPEEKKGFLGLFKKATQNIASLMFVTARLCLFLYFLNTAFNGFQIFQLEFGKTIRKVWALSMMISASAQTGAFTM